MKLDKMRDAEFIQRADGTYAMWTFLFDDNGDKIYSGDFVRVHIPFETNTYHESYVRFDHLGAIIDSHPAHRDMGLKTIRQLADYCDYGHGGDPHRSCEILHGMRYPYGHMPIELEVATPEEYVYVHTFAEAIAQYSGTEVNVNYNVNEDTWEITHTLEERIHEDDEFAEVVGKWMYSYLVDKGIKNFSFYQE